MAARKQTKTSKSRFGNRKKQMQSMWNTGKDKLPGLPPGTYFMRLSSLKFEEAKSSKKLQTVRKHVVLSGEHAGSEITDRIGFENDGGPYFTAKFIELMGHEPPADIDEFDDLYGDIVEDGTPYRATVEHNGDFINIRVEETVDEEDVEIDLDDEDEEEGEEVYETDEEDGDEDEDGDEEDGEDEEEDEEEPDDGEEEEDGDDDGVDEEDEELSEDAEVLLAIADAFSIEGVAEDMTEEEMASELKGYDISPDELDETEIEVLQRYGVLAKPKPKPKPKKKAPAKKAPAKAKAKASSRKRK